MVHPALPTDTSMVHPYPTHRHIHGPSLPYQQPHPWSIPTLPTDTSMVHPYLPTATSRVHPYPQPHPGSIPSHRHIQGPSLPTPATSRVHPYPQTHPGSIPTLPPATFKIHPDSLTCCQQGAVADVRSLVARASSPRRHGTAAESREWCSFTDACSIQLPQDASHSASH